MNVRQLTKLSSQKRCDGIMDRLKAVITPAFPGLPIEMVFKILGNLECWSLLSCRLVSQGWCQVSSTILQSRPTAFVRPRCSTTSTENDSLVSFICDKNYSLSSFINCFKDSQKFRHPFPHKNFVFGDFDGDLLKCPDLEPFFALTNEFTPDPACSFATSFLLIKCLRFNFIRLCPTFLNTLERLIFNQTPHLRVLGLCFDQRPKVPPITEENAWNKADIDMTVNSRMIPSLQVLQLEHCVGALAVKFVTKILRAAPNLRKIEGTDIFGFNSCRHYVFYADHLQPLKDAEKLHLVQDSLIWVNEKLVCDLAGKQLSGFQPKKLNLRLLDSRTDPASTWVDNLPKTRLVLETILDSVKNSVEELSSVDVLGLLDNRSLPLFSKLRRLHFSLTSKDFSILPPGIRDRREDIFPKLEKISLSIPRHVDESDIFLDLSSIPAIPSVRRLEIQPVTFTGVCLESLTLMCPNLRSLELSYTKYAHNTKGKVDFSLAGPEIWEKMKGLRTLILDMDLMHEANSAENPEAGFTGFSVATVKHTKANKPEDWPKVEDVEHLRVNPSILQMTELTKLILKNYVDKTEDAELSLSFKYAFDLMPALTVLIFQSK